MSKHNRERRERRRVERPAPVPFARRPLHVIELSEEFVAGRSPKRECGPCVACCHTANIVELGKPPNCDCEHQMAGGGCAVHATKPGECAGYYCMWRLGWGTDADRPDRNGVLISMNPNFDTDGADAPHFSVDVVELRPGALGARFPNGPPTELVPDDGSFCLMIYQHGVPWAAQGTFAERYRDHFPPEGQNRLLSLGAGQVVIQLGIVDRAGNMHTAGGVVPEALVDETIRKMIRIREVRRKP